MRNAFVDTIFEMAELDERIVLIVGDLGYKIFDKFKEKFPKRYINAGIAEANMVSMAAGMTLYGYKPFVYSIAPFVTCRCYEQIRNDVAYHNKNVVIVGVGGGYSYGHNGPTHHAIEDIALMRSIPNMKVLCPGDPLETRSIMNSLGDFDGPIYLRLGRAGEKKIHKEIPVFSKDKSYWFKVGDDASIISTGNTLSLALETSELLGKRNIFCSVISMPFVKPLDVRTIESACIHSKNIFTIEEHSIFGGFGSAVAEFIMELNAPVGFKRFGVLDCFPEFSGDQNFLREQVGLVPEKIADKIQKMVQGWVFYER